MEEDEYWIYKEGELIREISEEEEQLNEQAEVCPAGFDYSEAPGCADLDYCPFGVETPCPFR